jgi:hypothetical protein
MRPQGNRIDRTGERGSSWWFWRRRAALFVVIWVLACAAFVQAHELGTTRVSVVFHEGRSYDIDIVTDAPSLVEKLEALAGPQRAAGQAPNLSPSALGDRLFALDDIFRRRVTVAFDESAVHPAIAYAVSPAVDASSPILASIRLTGQVPREARHFTWLYSWTFVSYLLTVKENPSDTPATQWLEGGQASTPLPLTPPAPPFSRVGTAWRYFMLGFTHIAPNGLSHMLFVLAIFLMSGRVRTVLWQVSAFTLAHSITLGLSVYGLIAAPPAVLEPLIAVSIAYVAIENLLVTELKPWRIAPVFALGLLHGMGFGATLKDFGLARSDFLNVLLTFNVGVEAGQLFVIAAAFPLVVWQRGNRPWYHRRVVVPTSMIVACAAIYWTVESVTF